MRRRTRGDIKIRRVLLLNICVPLFGFFNSFASWYSSVQQGGDCGRELRHCCWLCQHDAVGHALMRPIAGIVGTQIYDRQVCYQLSGGAGNSPRVGARPKPDICYQATDVQCTVLNLFDRLKTALSYPKTLKPASLSSSSTTRAKSGASSTTSSRGVSIGSSGSALIVTSLQLAIHEYTSRSSCRFSKKRFCNVPR